MLDRRVKLCRSNAFEEWFTLPSLPVVSRLETIFLCLVIINCIDPHTSQTSVTQGVL